MPSLINEQQQWFDQDTGELIVNGTVYIGEQNLDPVLNPKGIYSDRALTVSLTNPQTTGADGRTGNKIWLSGNYSIKVDDSVGVQRYIELDNGGSGYELVNTVADLIAGDYAVGDWVETTGQDAAGDGGYSQFFISATDDDGEGLQLANGLYAIRQTEQIKASTFGNDFDAVIAAINVGNLTLKPVDIDIDATVSGSWALSDMIDVKTEVYSSTASRITYSVYGIPIFLIKKNGVKFGKGIELYWSGTTPSNAEPPQNWDTLAAAMDFAPGYTYNHVTTSSPVNYLGVDDCECRMNFTAASDSNLIHNCISVLPASTTTLQKFYIDCVFDGIVFGMNSQNFDGLRGHVKGKRYGNHAASGEAPGHLIYLTSVSNIDMWSFNIDLHVDDTEAVCVTTGLEEDDVSLKLFHVDGVDVVVHSNRANGAFDYVGRNVNFKVTSDRLVNRVGTEAGAFAFRVAQPTKLHHVTNDYLSYGNNGTLIYNTVPEATERGALITATGNEIQNSKFDLKVDALADYSLGTFTGDGTVIDLNINMLDPGNMTNGETIATISGSSNCENLTVNVSSTVPFPVQARFSQGNAAVGDVVINDVGGQFQVDDDLRRVTLNKAFSIVHRISGASTTPITYAAVYGRGEYEINVRTRDDGANQYYHGYYTGAIRASDRDLLEVSTSGNVNLEVVPSWTASNELTLTPNTNQSVNYVVDIIRR